jgi:hypothetical protein
MTDDKAITPGRNQKLPTVKDHASDKRVFMCPALRRTWYFPMAQYASGDPADICDAV